MDLFEAVEICYSDFEWREADDRTVLFVELIDVEDALSRDDCSLQAKVSESCVPWSREMASLASEANVEELASSKLFVQSVQLV